MAAASGMPMAFSPVDPSRTSVKIPSDWLREPHFTKRSDLYDARKADMTQLALEKTRVSPYFDKKFGRSEWIFRDSYRKNGVQEVLNKSATVDPSHFHPRAIASGSPTRTVMLEKRYTERHLESLKFEPPEIMRLADIPKPGAPELQNWWTKVDGYVEDPSPMIQNSLRLQLSPQRRVLGPVDPAKERCQASVDERRHVKVTKAELAEKITKISHHAPDDYHEKDRVENSVIIRAQDLYAQERRNPGGGGGGGGGGLGTRSESPIGFAISPIKPTQLRSPKRSHRHLVNLFLESTNQRALLDQIKACPPSTSASSPSSPSASRSGLPNSGLGTRSSSSFSLLQSSTEKLHAVKDYRDSVRCGGFS